MASTCVFCSKTEANDTDLIKCGAVRIKRIIETSKQRGDYFHKENNLESRLQSDPELKLLCHKSCVSTYTSKEHIKRSLKKRGIHERSASEPLVRRRRSSEFNFKEHCLICGDVCLPQDPKHPERWRTVVQCRTADRPGKLPFKDVLLQKCQERGDKLADEVRLRLAGVSADLHAADGQYHKDCYSKFMCGKNVSGCGRSSPTVSVEDEALSSVAEAMRKDPSRVWTALELHALYLEQKSNATALSRRQFISNLTSYLADDVLEMRIEGCASLIAFRQYIPYKLCKVDDNEGNSVDKMVYQITEEVKSIPQPKDYDLGQFVKATCIQSTSSTLLTLISKLISKGKITQQSLSISQSIQSQITKKSTATTLGLAVKLHHKFGSKELISMLNNYGYVVSYDEVLRFRSSAAKYVGEQDLTVRGLKKNSTFISSWCDNYDLNVCSPGGNRETHAMVIEFTQTHDDSLQDKDNDHVIIPRLSKAEMTSTKLNELSAVTFEHYAGPTKPLPPQISEQRTPLINITHLQESLTSALTADVRWLCAVSDNDQSEYEWAGFMTREARERGVTGNATDYVYGPLIDATPSHPDTVLTTLTFIQRFVHNHGQEHIMVVADMQLYQVIQRIKWADPDKWKTLIPRPGGMHTLMSFIGSIGMLMKGSGLEEILAAVFGGISSMLNGKAWPRAIRAFRMVVAGLLKDTISSGINTVTELEQILEAACIHPTGKLWVECFIFPVIIMLLFIRAEREGNWALHLYCMELMTPYFFAAGHWQYARFITYHCMEMRKTLPEDVVQVLLNGNHVCRHRPGVWNAVFSDQFGEQTYIKYGKSKGGLVGLTLSEEQVARWVLSNNICNLVSFSMERMFDGSGDSYDHDHDTHKEEGPSRTKLDKEDRDKIAKKLKEHINPLQTETAEVVNIYNGCVADSKVNVHNAVAIGDNLATEFKNNLPGGFYTALQKKIVTMETMKKTTRVGDSYAIYDMEKLYGRLLILSQKREMNLHDLFSYELAPVPSSLFDDYGMMRKSSKAVLTKKLSVVASNAQTYDTFIIDGNEMIYHVTWPKTGHVKQLSSNFNRAVMRESAEVYVVFDKYEETSIKDHERSRREGNRIYPNHILSLDTELPLRDAVMKNSHNKQQIIGLLCEASIPSNIHMIGPDTCVFQHEEADVNIISYLLQVIEDGRKTIQIVADDTDIFLLLVFYCWKWQLDQKRVCLYMKKSDGCILDINKSASSLGQQCTQILALHALTGCDTTSYPFGKGKLTALKLLTKVNLDPIGNLESTQNEILDAGTHFFALMYGAKSQCSMNELRYKVFSSKKNTPKIKSLPPTDSSLCQHILRAHLQVLLWKSAEKEGPPNIDIERYGWRMVSGKPEPTLGSNNMAPADLLKVVACGCTSTNICSRNSCSCKAGGLSCTSFCKCQGEEVCQNPNTVGTVDTSDEDESDCDV